MKLLRFLGNTILFVVFFWLQLFIVIGYSIAEVSIRPSGSIAVGGVIALLISYALVKKINKSNLWSRLFDETEVINDVVEEKIEKNKKRFSKENEPKKEIKKNKKSKMSNLANDLINLGELKEKGLLTEEEFNEQKRKLL
tara:strand:+ start:1453 stop:1872 length:420 start_codon:yes stop_codon:yes gene_type:complete